MALARLRPMPSISISLRWLVRDRNKRGIEPNSVSKSCAALSEIPSIADKTLTRKSIFLLELFVTSLGSAVGNLLILKL